MACIEGQASDGMCGLLPSQGLVEDNVPMCQV